MVAKNFRQVVSVDVRLRELIYFYFCNFQVEVRLREGRAVNIHMFCARRAGLLLSTMRALDNLGLDIQQAVISCFNGFALDVFRAEVPFFCLFSSSSTSLISI